MEGSATNYDEATIAKKITIIGTGYFLADAANPKTQWNTFTSEVYSFTLNSGSAGSVISGFTVTGSQNLNDPNITIERCYVKQIVFGNVENVNCDHDTIRQCVI